ncbi:MAG TPA: hypothetical protein VF316_14170 [Polyangiaceae bacterium]
MSHTLPRLAPFAVALVALLAAPMAHADETDACFSAPVDGQKLKNEGKLNAALAQFEMCARKSCPAEIVADCTHWAGAVENAIPSIVVAPRDAQGNDLLEVRVAVDDGAPIEVSGRAIVLDPGSHKLVFSREGVGSVVQEVLLREGEKNRVIVVRFEPPPPPPLAAQPAPPPATTVVTRPVPAATWIALTVGILALGSFGAVAGVGIAERSRNGCDIGCTGAQKDDVDLKFHVADALLAIGIIGVATAAVVYFTRPTATRSTPVLAIRF